MLLVVLLYGMSLDAGYVQCTESRPEDYRRSASLSKAEVDTWNSIVVSYNKLRVNRKKPSQNIDKYS